MALTLTQAQLSAAIRLGDSTEETAEATRLLGYVTAAISTHLADAYEDAPEAIVNEAAIRLAGYLFDQPNAGRGLSYANAGRNSGAWAILLPFRVHRAGSTGEAVAAAQVAVGSPDNQVTGVVVDSGYLVVTLAGGSITRQALPGMGGSEDQTARDAAAAAQGTANNAATAAMAAADTASANTGRLDAFPAGTGGGGGRPDGAGCGGRRARDGGRCASRSRRARGHAVQPRHHGPNGGGSGNGGNGTDYR